LSASPSNSHYEQNMKSISEIKMATDRKHTTRNSSQRGLQARRTWLISLITELRCKLRQWWLTTKTRLDECLMSKEMIVICRSSIISGILLKRFTFNNFHTMEPLEDTIGDSTMAIPDSITYHTDKDFTKIQTLWIWIYQTPKANLLLSSMLITK
jgi:hypothetical protein